MIITQEQKKLIKESWSYLLRRGSVLGQKFYPQLFKELPEAEHLFSVHPHEQGQKLRSVLTLIVTKLDKLENLEQEVRYLSKRHIGYRVRPVYFEAFGRILLDTFERTMGDRFTPAHREAWQLVFKLVSDQMIRVINSSEEGVVSFTH